MMDVRGSDLLALLGSGVRPASNGVGSPSAAIDGKSFSDLLAEVRAGGVSSGRCVECAAGLEGELTDEQLGRLSRVADEAEASGATRVAVLIDGRVAVLDVLNRRVEAVGEPGSGVVTGVDGFVAAPEEGEGEDSGAGVLDALGSLGGRAASLLLGGLG